MRNTSLICALAGFDTLAKDSKRRSIGDEVESDWFVRALRQLKLWLFAYSLCQERGWAEEAEVLELPLRHKHVVSILWRLNIRK